MLALGATTAGLATGAEDLGDVASTHVTELSDVAKDRFALGDQRGEEVWHGGVSLSAGINRQGVVNERVTR
jgi:hypothetical protein